MGWAAHPAGVGDFELLDKFQRPQAFSQVGLVGGRHDGRHARQAVDRACAAQPLVEIALLSTEMPSFVCHLRFFFACISA